MILVQRPVTAALLVASAVLVGLMLCRKRRTKGGST